jgi:hypothetical protein
MIDWRKPAVLFAATALAEIAGRCLPWLWLNGRAPSWVLVPVDLGALKVDYAVGGGYKYLRLTPDILTRPAELVEAAVAVAKALRRVASSTMP